MRGYATLVINFQYLLYESKKITICTWADADTDYAFTGSVGHSALSGAVIL